MDRIELTGLRAVGYHGVLEHERRDGQEFIADVTLYLDTGPAAAGDDLAATVNYATVAERAHAVLTGEPCQLIETVAQRIADAALASGTGYGTSGHVVAVDVAVHKPGAPIPVTFGDVTVRLHRVATVPVVLALGSNLGDRLATLAGAVEAVRRLPGVAVQAVSDVVETDPVGGEPQDSYLNAVVLATTTTPPRALLAACQQIEADFGRVRDKRWGPRTLDIDVIAYGQAVTDDPVLTLPHPRAHERAFVLVPWAQADPSAILPGPAGGPVAELAMRAGDRDGVFAFGPLPGLRAAPAARPDVEREEQG